MKKFIIWKCDVCDETFEFDADIMPARCLNCLSAHEHLFRVNDGLPESDLEDEG